MYGSNLNEPIWNVDNVYLQFQSLYGTSSRNAVMWYFVLLQYNFLFRWSADLIYSFYNTRWVMNQLPVYTYIFYNSEWRSEGLKSLAEWKSRTYDYLRNKIFIVSFIALERHGSFVIIVISFLPFGTGSIISS